MDNREDYLDALTEFSRRQPKEIPPLLEEFLKEVAKTGETLFPWTLLKNLFITKLKQVINEFGEEYKIDEPPSCPNVENAHFDVYRQRIMEAVHSFYGTPFTIQRLCELLTDPRRHYKRGDKFMRGLEKNVMVVSTVDPFGRKVVSEPKAVINGMEMYESDTSSNASPTKAPRTSSSTSTEPDIIPSTSALLEVSDLPDPMEPSASALSGTEESASRTDSRSSLEVGKGDSIKASDGHRCDMSDTVSGTAAGNVGSAADSSRSPKLGEEMVCEEEETKGSSAMSSASQPTAAVDGAQDKPSPSAACDPKEDTENSGHSAPQVAKHRMGITAEDSKVAVSDGDIVNVMPAGTLSADQTTNSPTSTQDCSSSGMETESGPPLDVPDGDVGGGKKAAGEPPGVTSSGKAAGEPQDVVGSRQAEEEPQIVTSSGKAVGEPQDVIGSGKAEGEPGGDAGCRKAVEEHQDALSSGKAVGPQNVTGCRKAEGEPEDVTGRKKAEEEPQDDCDSVEAEGEPQDVGGSREILQPQDVVDGSVGEAVAKQDTQVVSVMGTNVAEADQGDVTVLDMSTGSSSHDVQVETPVSDHPVSTSTENCALKNNPPLQSLGESSTDSRISFTCSTETSLLITNSPDVSESSDLRETSTSQMVYPENCRPCTHDISSSSQAGGKESITSPSLDSVSCPESSDNLHSSSETTQKTLLEVPESSIPLASSPQSSVCDSMVETLSGETESVSKVGSSERSTEETAVALESMDTDSADSDEVAHQTTERTRTSNVSSSESVGGQQGSDCSPCPEPMEQD